MISVRGIEWRARVQLLMLDPLKLFWVITNSTYLGMLLTCLIIAVFFSRLPYFALETLWNGALFASCALFAPLE